MLRSSLSGARVLVTGASGFIGSHLCQRLCTEGMEVHGVSRRDVGPEQGVARWWRGDLAEAASVRRLLLEVKPDVIFHLAGHVAGARGLNLVLPTFRHGLMTTVHLLAEAGEIGCRRLILTGSMEEPEAWDLAATPSSPYAAAKWAASAYGRMFHALYGLPVVNLRVFMVYGPGQRDLRKLVPYVILSLLRGEAPRLGTGRRQVDWIYVTDVVDAFLAAAQVPGIEGSTIDVGSGELVSIHTVVDRLVEFVGSSTRPQFGARPDRPLEQERAADVTRSQTLLGWRPRTGLEEGLRQTVEWYAAGLRTGTVPAVGFPSPG